VELGAEIILHGIEDFADLDDAEEELYFTHSDHLGSSSFITDASGEAVQHLQYLPFGEHFVSQTSSGWESRYTFSGKEKDVETGYSYFGARYYDSDISVWLSVDPMSDKHPNFTPYSYCYNNPVNLIDPVGLDTGDVMVSFGGGDWKGTGDQGTAAPEVANLVNKKNFEENGGSAKSFSSAFVNVDPSNSDDLDAATQEAYDYIKQNYDAAKGGIIAIYGYSMGGVMATHLASRLEADGVTVSILVTVDAAAAWKTSSVSRLIPTNVLVNVNYYQTEESTVGSHGAANTAKSSSTKVFNINLTGGKLGSTKVEHGTIDNFTLGPATAEILNVLEGRRHYGTDSRYTPPKRR